MAKKEILDSNTSQDSNENTIEELKAEIARLKSEIRKLKASHTRAMKKKDKEIDALATACTNIALQSIEFYESVTPPEELRDVEKDPVTAEELEAFTKMLMQKRF